MGSRLTVFTTGKKYHVSLDTVHSRVTVFPENVPARKSTSPPSKVVIPSHCEALSLSCRGFVGAGSSSAYVHHSAPNSPRVWLSVTVGVVCPDAIGIATTSASMTLRAINMILRTLTPFSIHTHPCGALFQPTDLYPLNTASLLSPPLPREAPRLCTPAAITESFLLNINLGGRVAGPGLEGG